VIYENLHLLRVIGVDTERVVFPFVDVESAVARRRVADGEAPSPS
jgi:hypothetical protein